MDKRIVDMTYNEIISLEPLEKAKRLKEYRKYLTTIINKLYMKAIKYKDFSFSKDEEDLTLYQMAEELKEFLKNKNITDEEIKDIVYKGAIK